MMSVQNGNPSFNAKLTTGNPLAQTIRVVDTNLVRWTVRNSQHTPWLMFTPNGDFGDGIFSVSVNIYDNSVIVGTQQATLFIEPFIPKLVPTITCTITLTVQAS
jgi:hypothetical protein